MFVLYCSLLVAFLFGSGPLDEFTKRVEQYAKLHKQIDHKVPDLKKETDPKVIVQREKEFADGIRAARPLARQGDIFIPAVQPIFREIIKQETTGEAGRKNRSMILGEGNPKGPEAEASPKVVVHAPYPSAAPLSTVPPSVLKRLPLLPEALQYRFIGHTLILWDTTGNFIVDFMPDAIG
jgi:hypothetical protein